MIQIKKTILTLVALFAMTTGAWADEGTLLTTITPDGNGNPVYTVADVATLDKGGADYSSDWGWNKGGEAWLTITPAANVTITKVKFTTNAGDSWEDTEAPFRARLEGLWVFDDKGNNMDNGEGVTKIEVYGAAASSGSAVEVAWNKATKTGTFKMLGGNVELEPEYYPQAVLAAEPTPADGAKATTDDLLVSGGTVATITGSNPAAPQGTLMYYVSTTTMSTEALLALDADAWTADVPTAADLAQGQAYVYYYVRGNDSDTDDEIFSDGDILAANALTVTIAAAPTYAVTFAEGIDEPTKWTASPAANVTKGETVTVSYTGSKKVLGVKAEKKSAKAPTTAQLNVPTGWNGDNTNVTANDLPGFVALTDEEAANIPCPDAEGYVYVIHNFVGDGYIRIIAFYNGERQGQQSYTLARYHDEIYYDVNDNQIKYYYTTGK